LVFSYGLFGDDINSLDYGLGIGGFHGINDCGRIDPSYDGRCSKRTSYSAGGNFAIFILYDTDRVAVADDGIAVSTPSLLSIFGLGLLGIMSRRIKKKTI
jgi:hypothetical protein